MIQGYPHQHMYPGGGDCLPNDTMQLFLLLPREKAQRNQRCYGTTAIEIATELCPKACYSFYSLGTLYVPYTVQRALYCTTSMRTEMCEDGYSQTGDHQQPRRTSENGSLMSAILVSTNSGIHTLV
jgi:hypothetical protein